MKEKLIKTVVITYEQFSEWDFVPVGSYYIRDAMGNFTFMKTSDRMLAQKHVDEIYGKGKYRVIPSKDDKTKSKEYTARGTSTR